MVELQPVDAVAITLVVDNFVDILLAGAELQSMSSAASTSPGPSSSP